MSSREQFEAWLSSEYQWANDTLNEAHFHGDDETGYYTGGDFIYDGRSCSDALFWAWRGWQEIHQQGEAKCAALAAELKQSQIDAGCYKRGMEASNERLVQVAAENAGLKGCTVNHAPAVEHWNAWADAEDKIAPVPETPATDAFLAEVRAQGVEMFAEQQRSFIGKPSKNDAASSYSSREAISFAAQLRKGASA